MPMAWARAASILSLPVSSISLACFGSTAHGSSMATMPVPKRTSGSPKRVPSAAIVMSQARWLERSIWPYLVAMQAIPILALVPIIGSIFGFEINSRIFVCVLISLFPIVSNTLFGLLSAERGQHDLFTLHHVSRWTRLRKLQLPNAMPTIFTGFRIAAGLSVIGAIVGEIFFKRGDKGVGILLDSYRSRAQFPQMYGALLLAAALGIVVFIIFGWLNNLVVGRWYESTRKSN